MFPAIRLTPFDQALRPSFLDTKDIDVCISNLGYYYTIGLYHQMNELHNLSKMIFGELEKDFYALNDRIKVISDRISKFKTRAQAIIDYNRALPPQAFAQRECVQNKMPNDTIVQDAKLDKADVFVQKLLEKAYPPPSLEKFQCVIPNYKELEKQISDPNQFAEQYKQELLSKYKELVQHAQRKRDKKIDVNPIKPDEKSRTMLNVYMQTLAPPSVTLLIPPPPGHTSGWRDYALKEMKGSSNMQGNESAHQYIAPAPSVAPSVRVLNRKPQVSNISPQMQTAVETPQQAYTREPSHYTEQPHIAAPQRPVIENKPLPPPPPSVAPPSAAPPAPSVSAPSVATPAPAPKAALGHLDLIKQGGFKLKPVKKEENRSEIREDIDPSSLSVGELLARVAKIREDTKLSESEDEESVTGSSYDW